jgi:predicted PurR-regulated permease PerM
MPPSQKNENGAQLRPFVMGIFIFLAIGFLYLSRDFLLPLTLAMLVAITLRPAVRGLSQRGVPAGVTAATFAAFLLVVGLVVSYVISVPVSRMVADAPAMRQILAEKIHKISAPLEQVAKMTDDLKAATATAPKPVNEVVVKEPSLPALFWVAMYPASYSLMFAGALILSLFLMASGDLLLEKLLNVMPTLTDKKQAFKIVQDVEHEVSVYLVTQSAINAGVGLAVGLSFYFVGMPTAYLWGLSAFVLNFIPYVGPLTGVILSGLFSFVFFDSFAYSLVAPLAYLAIVLVEGQAITPNLLGRRLRMNAVAILVALAFWGWIWGIPGMIVAIPLLVTLRIFCIHFESLTTLGEFLGEASTKISKTNQNIIHSEKVN